MFSVRISVSVLNFVLFLSLVGLAVGNLLPRVKINDQHLFEDEDGRVVILHGTSFVDKGFDMVRVTDDQMDTFKNKWGMNLARVGILWDLVEPQPGVYNETYLSLMVNLLEQFHKHGIYTMLDMHQDVWARQYCGHGIPDFYSNPPDDPRYKGQGAFAFPRPVASPKPGESGCKAMDSSPLGWISGYVTFALSSGVQGLYDNRNGYLTKFGDFWHLVASKTANMTGNLGYELINEPWMGDIWNDLSLLIPGRGDHKNMEPMYEYLHKRIREVDDDGIIFYESGYAGNFFDSVGFKKGVGGDKYKDRRVLSYHMYCPIVQADLNVNGSIWNWIYKHLGWTANVDCDLALGTGVVTRFSDVRRLGGGGLLTEFGALPDNLDFGGDTANFLMGELDARFAGWAYWMNPTNSSGNEGYVNPARDTTSKLVELFARPFPHAIAGVPKRLKFNPYTREFSLIYIPSSASNRDRNDDQLIESTTFQPPATAKTEIYASSGIVYPEGFDITIDPPSAATVTFDENTGVLTITHTEKAMQIDELTINLMKKL